MNPETAIRRLTCLVLFLALGLGLVAGGHPCQAQPAAPAPEAAPEPATACSAHAAATEAGPGLQSSAPDGERDCCAEHGADCAYACQAMAGVVHAGTLQVAEEASVRTAAPAAGPFLPLFAHAIDHIPLA
jgi:hypothetical protein